MSDFLYLLCNQQTPWCVHCLGPFLCTSSSPLVSYIYYIHTIFWSKSSSPPTSPYTERSISNNITFLNRVVFHLRGILFFRFPKTISKEITRLHHQALDTSEMHIFLIEFHTISPAALLLSHQLSLHPLKRRWGKATHLSEKYSYLIFRHPSSLQDNMLSNVRSL